MFPRDVRAVAAKDRVAAIRALGCRRQTIQIRTATDDVVLTEIAVDRIVAAVAFDVIITVGRVCSPSA